MSEEITEKEEFIKIVSILSFSDVHPADCKYITHFIIDLAKENQQLKKANEILKENAIHNDKVVDDTNWKIKQYKSVLDEIREYIDGVVTIWKTNPSAIATLDLEYLLQQIDKVNPSE